MKTQSNHLSACPHLLARTIGALLLVGAPGFASATIDVVYDDADDFHDYGELWAGSTQLMPPSYACGRKFPLAGNLHWVNEMGGTIRADELWKDVLVWIPRNDCPYETSIKVEYADGSASFEPPLGTYRLEINTQYGSKWVDDSGTWPFVNGVFDAPDGFLDEQPEDWRELVKQFDALKIASLDTPWHKAKVMMAEASTSLTALVEHVDTGIDRGDLALDDARNDNIDRLEEQTMKQLRAAATSLELCGKYFASGRATAKAYRSCDLARIALLDARTSWQLAASERR